MIQALLGVAIEQLAKAIAIEISTGVLETLLHQAAIDEKLKRIEAKLNAIMEFLVHELPTVVEQVVVRNAAAEHYRLIKAKAELLQGKILRIEANEKHGQAPTEFDIKEVVGAADACLESGSVLIDMGQTTATAVAYSFLIGAQAYKFACRFDESQFVTFQDRASKWVGRLAPWTDPTKPSSLAGIRNERKKMADAIARYIPGLTETTTEFVVSFMPREEAAMPPIYIGPPGPGPAIPGYVAPRRVDVYVGWFGFGTGTQQGDELYRSWLLGPGESYEVWDQDTQRAFNERRQHVQTAPYFEIRKQEAMRSRFDELGAHLNRFYEAYKNQSYTDALTQTIDTIQGTIDGAVTIANSRTLQFQLPTAAEMAAMQPPA